MFRRQSIVHVMHYGNQHAGSIIPLLCALGQRLEQRGHRFSLISTAVDSATWVTAVQRLGVELHIVRDVPEAAALVRQLNPTIVHCHFDTQTATSLALVGVPTRIFWHIHTARPPRAQNFTSYLKSLVKYRVVGLQTELFLTVSSALADELKRWGAPGRKVRPLPLGIDTAWFRPPSAEERLRARATYAIEPEETVLLFFGRDSEVKGTDLLERALKRTQGLTLMAVGLEPQWESALASSTERLISLQPSESVRELYWAADRLVMPSRREGLGLTLLEGLGCGLQVLTSDIPVFNEIAQGMPGFVATNVNDPETFGHRLSETKRVQNNSHEVVSQKWSIDAFVDGCEKVYALDHSRTSIE